MRKLTSYSIISILIASAIATAVWLAPLKVYADDDDQERARAAMLSGEVRPLRDLLAVIETLYEGEIIEVELEDDEDGLWTIDGQDPIFLYEIKLLTPQGNVMKLEFDARTLDLLTVDGHDSERARKDKHKDKRKDKYKDND